MTLAESTDTSTLRILGRSVRVSVRSAVGVGAGSRPPLLLCNGIGAGLEILSPLVEAIRPDVEVISFDVPGAGSSPTPRLPYGLPGMASLVAGLVAKLGHRKIDVLGYSWGGGLAQQFAVQYPNRCRRLVLASTSTGVVTIPGRPQALARMLTPRRHRDPAYATSIAPTLYGGSVRANPEVAGELLGGQRHQGMRGYLYQLGALLTWTSMPYLGLLRQPTLLLFGDDDPIIPVVNGRIMNALLPQSVLHIFHGGHLYLLSNATDLAPVIDEFLDRE